MTWTLDGSTPTLDADSPFATLDGSGGNGSLAGTFYWSHSYGVSRKVEIKLNKSQFGDGYMQRTGKGINNIVRVWDLRFNARNETIAQQISDFLEVRSQGQSFSWTPLFLNPTDAAIRVLCESFEVVPRDYNSFDITATFQEVYGE